MKRIEAPILLLALSAFLAAGGGLYRRCFCRRQSRHLGHLRIRCLHARPRASLCACGRCGRARHRSEASRPIAAHAGHCGPRLSAACLHHPLAGLSQYKMQSLISFADWLMYGVAFMASAAIVGRKEGPKLLCGAFVARSVASLHAIIINRTSSIHIMFQSEMFA